MRNNNKKINYISELGSYAACYACYPAILSSHVTVSNSIGTKFTEMSIYNRTVF